MDNCSFGARWFVMNRTNPSLHVFQKRKRTNIPPKSQLLWKSNRPSKRIFSPGIPFKTSRVYTQNNSQNPYNGCCFDYSHVKTLTETMVFLEFYHSKGDLPRLPRLHACGSSVRCVKLYKCSWPRATVGKGIWRKRDIFEGFCLRTPCIYGWSTYPNVRYTHDK